MNVGGEQLEQVFQYIDLQLDRWVAELAEWLRIPSVGHNDEAMTRARAWIMARLARAEISSQALESEQSHPLVVAHLDGASDKTLLFFNHYDVANYTHDVRDYATEFLGDVRDGKIFGRGAADDKGCLFSRVAAVEALTAVLGQVPVGVTFLMQGKRHANDPGLAGFVDRNKALLKADAVIWESGAKDAEDRPVMSLGAKGYLYVDVTVRRANHDFPSRDCIFPNAAWDLTWALSSLKDRQERVLIDGFYDDIVPLSAGDKVLLQELAGDIGEDRLAALGADDFLLGLRGAELAKQQYLTPSCTICGLTSGFSGPGQKLLAPAQASAKLEFRLVPNQRPDDILAKLRKHFAKQGFDYVRVEQVAETTPYRTQPEHPIVQTALKASKRVYDKPLVIRPLSSGMSPKYVFNPLATIGLGVEYAGSRMEMSDEHIRIEDFRQGIKMIAALLMEYGAEP